ncbi:MAG: GTPase domain-containing protein [Sandaracinaceae bacterium]|nr:GTPase domain-containing protein [Sandaracinaceae bacterium]
MPTIHSERGVLVVRVVYDGAPLSGKTTTLRTLAERLGVGISSPEERDGRTMFFDWVDYVGGLFDGRQIHCQIVSVPGQEELRARREHLLASADAIVLVADTRASEIDGAYDVLRELRPRCREEQPPVGLVLQANKRDDPDAVARHRIHEAIEGIVPVAIVETIATTGEGVREAFVFAVRLALDRVRALADAGLLHEGRPDVDGPDELLEELTSLEKAAGVSPAWEPAPAAEPSPFEVEIAQLSPLRAAVQAAMLSMEEEKVFVPDPMMPGGFIWPPVDGRTLLAEVSRLDLVPTRTSRGDWWASGSGWRFHSSAEALYPDADGGRRALIDWARMHAVHSRVLSSGRTVILAGAGSGRFRLWQLVRVMSSLRELLMAALEHAEPEQLVLHVRGAAEQLLRAHDAILRSELGIPCTLWTVSADFGAQPHYVGLMPFTADPGAADQKEIPALLEREFTPILRGMSRDRSDYARIRGSLARWHAREPSSVAAATLARVAEAATPET